MSTTSKHASAYRHRFSSQDNKTFSPSSEESSQFMSENTFNFIRLFDFDADADRVDRRLDKDLFVLVACYMQWIQNDFGRCPEVSMTWRGEGYFASISGTLCRSTTWLEKFSRHNAAVKLARTQFRYGRSVFAYKRHQHERF